MYKSKLKSRLHSLFVPYIFWNTVLLIVFYMIGALVIEGGKTVINYYEITDWIRAYWNINSNKPVCFQLWFIRDLMVMNVLSPIVWHTIKECKYLISIFFAIWLIGWNFDPINLTSTAMFFYSLGAFFAIQGVSLKMSRWVSWSVF